MLLPVKDRLKLKEAALGLIPCDLVIKNVNMLNVFTGEVYKADVGVWGNAIAHINCDPDNLGREETPIEAKQEIDGTGKYLIPGLIDAHIHIESTMMIPKNFAKAVIPQGTTTVITDPHEIGNVCGIEGVEYMLENSEGLPMRQFVLAPSCVPAVLGKENAGASFDSKEVAYLMENHERVIGLAEVMDYVGVINNDPRMVRILDEAYKNNLFMQGHAPFVSGRQLSAYVAGGPVSDHECRISQEAKDKVRVGMYIDGRESSITKNLNEIIPAFENFRYLDRLCLCTDDKECDDIGKTGHMNEVVRMAIKYGLEPVDAIRSATFNNAREVGILNLGAIAPGYIADMVLVDGLDTLNVDTVIYEGDVVFADNKLTKEIEKPASDVETRNTVYIKDLTVDDFKMKAPIDNGNIDVNVISYPDLFLSNTDIKVCNFPVKDGIVDLSEADNFKYVIIINRHKEHDTISYGIVENFGTTHGAMASTISHDSHNLTIVYDKPEDAYACYKELEKVGGGIACARTGEVFATLQLEVAGLMSARPAEELAPEIDNMKDAMKELGLVNMPNPILRIAVLALPVVPNVKMSDMGIIEVATQNILPLFPNN